jgi:hypothetical protein
VDECKPLPDGPLLEDFAKWRAGLEKEGFFKPSPAHLAYRVAELAAMFALGTWLMSVVGRCRLTLPNPR